MDSARDVSAQFSLNQYPLTVGLTGSGSGTVSSAPAGIQCGATCSATYNSGTSVTLTAASNVWLFLHGLERRLQRAGDDVHRARGQSQSRLSLNSASQYPLT